MMPMRSRLRESFYRARKSAIHVYTYVYMRLLSLVRDWKTANGKKGKSLNVFHESAMRVIIKPIAFFSIYLRTIVHIPNTKMISISIKVPSTYINCLFYK